MSLAYTFAPVLNVLSTTGKITYLYINLHLWEESLNSDDQEFHTYKQIEQS